MKLLIPLFLLLLALEARASDGKPDPARKFREEASKQAEIYNSVGQSVPQGYVVDRSLLSYAFTLSPEFRHSLARLGAQDRWLDIGAGEGRAVLDYSTSKYDVIFEGAKEGGAKAQAVAMSIEDRRTARWHEAAARLGEKEIQYLFGRRLREYSQEELGQFQLVTDFLGGFSYTRYLTRFMTQALGLLAVDGSFHTLLQDVQSEDGKNRPFHQGARFLTEIVNSDGSEVKLCTWLKSIRCAEVTCELKPDSSPPVEVYRIRKVCSGISVPQLVPIHFEAGTPPERRYQLKSPLRKVLEPIGPRH